MLREQLEVIGMLDHPGCQVQMHVGSDLEWTTRLKSCAKEPGTVKWLEQTLRPGDVLFDIGANVGAYALLAARLYRGDVRVIAVEPSVENFAQLVRNVALNRCEEVVTALQVALDSETRMATFHYSDTRSGSALHALGAGDRTDPPFVPAAHQRLMAFRLDDLVRQFGLPTPTHVKIDVDGGELGVLRGATTTMAHSAVRSVMIEVDEDGADHAAIAAALRAAGLQLVERQLIVPPALAGMSGMYNWLLERR